MIQYDREKEVKLESTGIELLKVFSILEARLFHSTLGFVAGDVVDAFWTLPQYKRGFVRIRTNHGHAQQSIKIEDKNNVLDRIEENQDLLCSFDTAVKQKSLELGKDPKFLVKRHFTFFLSKDNKTSICCYEVYSEDNKVYIEIESPDVLKISFWEAELCKLFKTKHKINFKRAKGSLYQMYIEGK